MDYQGGVTLVSTLVAVAIATMLIAAVGLLFSTVLGGGRSQRVFEQVLTTEDARVLLERMSDRIRNARDEIDSTGAPIDDGSPWLLEAEDNRLHLVTNFDNDPEHEELRYQLEGTTLYQWFKQPGAPGVETKIATSLRNQNWGKPLFTYLDAQGNRIDSQNATEDNVRRIGINLIIDPDPNQDPPPAEVDTIVTLRRQYNGNTVNSARLWPTQLNLPQGSPPTSDAVEVTVTNPQTGVPTTEEIDMVELNRNRLFTYESSYYVNINYQSQDQGSYPAGWYAYVGPILVGESGSVQFEEIDQVPIDEVCTGSNLPTLLQNCPERTVTAGGSFEVTYQPILTHDAGGNRDYVNEITFTATDPDAESDGGGSESNSDLSILGPSSSTSSPRFQVSNGGPDDVDNIEVTITDLNPSANMTGQDSGTGFSCTQDSTTKDITCNYSGTLLSLDTVSHGIDLDQTLTGAIFEVSSSTNTDPNTADNTYEMNTGIALHSR